MTRLILTIPERERISSILQLYDSFGGENLPPPDEDDIDQAINAGEFFSLESAGGEILGASGISHIGLGSDGDIRSIIPIIELTGTVVAPIIRGLKPVSAQKIFLGVRMLQIAASGAGPFCVMSSVIIENSQSLDNLKSFGLHPVHIEHTWAKRMRRSWHRAADKQAIDLVAGDNCVEEAAKLLHRALGAPLTRTNNGVEEHFRLELGDRLSSCAVADPISNLPKPPQIKLSGRLPARRVSIEDPMIFF